MDLSPRHDFLRYARFQKAAELRVPYGMYMEPDLRTILAQLEQVNHSYFVLNHALMRAWLSQGCWAIWPGQRASDGQNMIYGFIIPPKLLNASMVIKANGRVLDGFEYPVGCGIDDRIIPTGGRSFGCAAPFCPENYDYPEQPIRFTCESVNGFVKMPAYTDYWLLPPTGDPVPSDENMHRVGSPDKDMFLLDGSSFYAKLGMLTRQYLDKPLDSVEPILDWGCGCGKMARFFPKERRHGFVGADIDSVNVEWCRQNLPGARFETIEKHPPAPFPDNHFEVAYGNSVFTHLREDHQFEWLEELRRIIKPGGLALVTVHGVVSFALLGWFEAYSVLNLLQKGIRVAENYNPDLGEFGSDIYYDVAHTQQYVIDQWSKYFDVIDILEGFSRGELAMVVLRKRLE